MKKQIILLVALNIVCSFSVNAGPGGTGGIGTVPTLRMNSEILLKRDEISALITRNGDYARLEDLEEGFEYFKGIEISRDILKIDATNELHSIILSSGEVKEIALTQENSLNKK